MRSVNFKHLHYFWVVAHEGSIATASERLFVSPQTISAQLRQLESQFGQPLFEPGARQKTLTRAGEIALNYADEIFDLGQELTAAMAAESAGTRQVCVGIGDVVPKLIASAVLLPVIEQIPAPRLICSEGLVQDLLLLLAQRKLDFVLSDHPAPPDANLTLYSHSLGQTGISFMAVPEDEYGSDFPACLDGAPILLPGKRSALRTALENWFRQQNVTVRVTGEFDDSALIKAFGQRGAGIFACPTAIEAEVSRQYAVKAVGRTRDIRETYYLISTAKRLSQPLFTEVQKRAQTELFGKQPASDG